MEAYVGDPGSRREVKDSRRVLNATSAGALIAMTGVALSLAGTISPVEAHKAGGTLRIYNSTQPPTALLQTLLKPHHTEPPPSPAHKLRPPVTAGQWRS
jgi:hypothetical protein